MPVSRVAVIRCESYDYASVKEAIARGISLVGGAHRFARASERILLKPNLLAGDPPEKCVTTHPAVFTALAESLAATGAQLIYGDSPSVGSPLAVARKAGIAQAADKLTIPLADFTTGQEVIFEQGRQNKKFFIARGVLESDGLVSLAKLKTHGFQVMTGSIKNQFGCIPGLLKGEFHVRTAHPDQFARMLVDLTCLLKPRLYVMDGIEAMEGNGPRGGRPRKMNALLLSTDPVALDATVCRMIHLDPSQVPTLKFGMQAGLGTYLESGIEILGDDLTDFIDREFDLPHKQVWLSGNMANLIGNRLVAKPEIVKKKCVKCGICIQACPVTPKALEWPDGDETRYPVYGYKRCIKCYCCQEMCPEGAIILRVPLMRRLLPL